MVKIQNVQSISVIDMKDKILIAASDSNIISSMSNIAIEHANENLESIDYLNNTINLT